MGMRVTKLIGKNKKIKVARGHAVQLGIVCGMKYKVILRLSEKY